jgi:hypothetical protein
MRANLSWTNCRAAGRWRIFAIVCLGATGWVCSCYHDFAILDSMAETDSDTQTTMDSCPDDPKKNEPGWCGCGRAEGTCPGIEVSQATYTVEDSIVVRYWSLPGNALDWIGLHESSWEKDYHSYEYTLGAVEGVLEFVGLPPGNYEARLYFDNTYTVVDRAPFQVVQGSHEAIVQCQADAHVSQDKPFANHGNSDTLLVTTSPTRYESYLKFKIPSGSEPMNRVLLRLASRKKMMNGPTLYLTDNDWLEFGITWKNRPSARHAMIANLEMVAKNWGQIDLTDSIAEPGTYSIILVPDSEEEGSFSSRQTPFSAYLVVVTGE